MPNWCNNDLTIQFSKRNVFENWLEKIMLDDLDALEINEMFLPKANFDESKTDRKWHPIEDYCSPNKLCLHAFL